MDSILEYERKPEEDFYSILGVDELSDVRLHQEVNHTFILIFWSDLINHLNHLCHD